MDPNYDSPFSDAQMRHIFRQDAKHLERLISRESTNLEFKLSFHGGTKWNEYGRTIAAFANTRGGYLVFGVSNNPRTLAGLKDNRFSSLDPAQFSGFLNEKFAPEIEWQMHVHNAFGKEFGLLYIAASTQKPVIAISEGGDHIHDGEIYYRYHGRSQKIRYSELRAILDEARRQEQEVWLKHFQRIAEVGVRDAAIFDPNAGTVAGRGGVFVIDKTLLPKLKFIREGQFNEREGAPAVKIVGEAQALAAGEILPARTRIQPKAIHFAELVEFFLRNDTVDDPLEFIRAATQETSAYVPIYFYLAAAKLSRSQGVTEIRRVQTVAPAKSGLIERLTTADGGCKHIIASSDTPASRRKREIKARFLNRAPVDSYVEGDYRYLLQVVRSLQPTEIDQEYVRRLLSHFYSRYESLTGTVRDEFRRAVCHLDQVLWRPEVPD